MSSRSGPRRRPGNDRRDAEPPRDRDRGPSRDRDRSGVGGDQIEGRRAVRELLRARSRRVRGVSVAQGLAASDLIDEIVELAEGLGVPVRWLPPERLDDMARTEAPQGVIARADALAPADLDALLQDPAAFLVALDGVTDPQNLGAILRTAELAGATGAIVPRHRAVHVTPAVAKAAAGAIEYIPIAVVGGVPQALERAARAGVWTVGLDADADSSLFDLQIADRPIVVVLGAEGRGLSRLTRARCDLVAGIPMSGRLDSLNVSVAAGLALFEVARRRMGSPE